MAVTEIPFEEMRTLLLPFYEAQIAVPRLVQSHWPEHYFKTDGTSPFDLSSPQWEAYRQRCEELVQVLDQSGTELMCTVPDGSGQISARRLNEGSFMINYSGGLVKELGPEAQMELLLHA